MTPHDTTIEWRLYVVGVSQSKTDDLILDSIRC